MLWIIYIIIFKFSGFKIKVNLIYLIFKNSFKKSYGDDYLKNSSKRVWNIFKSVYYDFSMYFLDDARFFSVVFKRYIVSFERDLIHIGVQVPYIIFISYLKVLCQFDFYLIGKYSSNTLELYWMRIF